MNLTRSQRNEILRELYRRSYFEFFCAFWSTISSEKLILNWHIRYLCDELQKIGERVIRREPKEYDLVINISPGESKSTICTQLFEVWLWTIDPTLKIISGSYSKDLSIGHAVKSRDCILSDRFQELYADKIILKKDLDNKSRYANTLGGERMSVSVGSTVTGFHAHLLVIDDPLSATDAMSDKKRRTANLWMQKVLSSRKVDEAITPTILIMQRLHEDDCTSDFLRRNPKAKHICLPATSDYPVKPEYLIKSYINGFMNPLRRGKEVVEDKVIDLGETEFAGQYGQQPAPPGGNMIKKEWFNEYDRLDLKGAAVNFYIDGAYTANTTNDPTAIMAFAVVDKRMVVLNVMSVWKEFPDLIEFIKKYVGKLGYSNNSIIFVEPKATGKSIVQTIIASTGLNIVESESPTKDKIARLNDVLPFIRSGRVWIDGNSAWKKGFVDQCLVFPNGAHDDEVDCLSGAAKICRDFINAATLDYSTA